MDKDKVTLASRVEDLENDVHHLQEDMPSTMYLDDMAKTIDEHFRQLSISVNERLHKMEEKYRSIDPKYLAMGETLSEANRNVIKRMIEDKEFLFKEILKLKHKIQELSGG